ncbi:hypothetical protein QWY86_15360 [Pedobacter aquatilis]|uniref:hypothetical protein n=1 Tax=Pedobacter aquatilis TaxID=351343 RepID=UPI0025B4F7DE|nr:hypothetical protein [Pedobacter aquatilis]MDN3588060.1 hypothetical protein [Pedobacter aquatilis]
MVHIGKIIRDLVRERGLKAVEVSTFMSMSTSNLFDIYKREEIDIYKLGKFSELLNDNLFKHYLTKEALKKIFGSEISGLEDRVRALEIEVLNNVTTINNLHDLIENQKKVIALQEEKLRK